MVDLTIMKHSVSLNCTKCMLKKQVKDLQIQNLYRNKSHNLIPNSKQEYNNKKFESVKSDLRKT